MLRLPVLAIPGDDQARRPSPAVSVITPAYNAADYLEQAVQSALAQTFADFELLIVDDGSTDATSAIARRLAEQDPRVHAIRTRRVGVAAARNVGLRHARGRHFAFLDSDDIWLPEYLSAQLAVFGRAPATDVVAGNAFNLGGPLDGQPFHPASAECPSVTLLDMIEHDNAVCIMSVVRRAVVETIGGFSEDLCRSEDYDFWLRAALAGFHFVANRTPLVRYRRRTNSASSDELLMLDAMVEVLHRTRLSPLASHSVVAAIDRRLTALDEQRLLGGAKIKLLRRDYAAAAADLERLSRLRQSLRNRFIAGASRSAPAVLRLAYQAKSALRV